MVILASTVVLDPYSTNHVVLLFSIFFCKSSSFPISQFSLRTLFLYVFRIRIICTMVLTVPSTQIPIVTVCCCLAATTHGNAMFNHKSLGRATATTNFTMKFNSNFPYAFLFQGFECLWFRFPRMQPNGLGLNPMLFELFLRWLTVHQTVILWRNRPLTTYMCVQCVYMHDAGHLCFSEL